MVAPGKHIAFEGIDGSGKTSISSKIYLSLKEQGIACHYTYEPTNTRIGSYIHLHFMKRDISNPPLEALLYAADRVQHYEEEILGYLDRGHVTISDRYVHSSIAYQGALLGDSCWVAEINRMVPKPDLAIYLRIEPKVALARKSKKNRTVYERENFLRKVVEIYDRLAKSGELVVVDASRSFDEVFKDVYSIAAKNLRRYPNIVTSP